MSEQFKVLCLSTNDRGGAGLSLLKGVERLRKKGVDITMLVCNKYSDSDACIGVFDAHTRMGRLRILLNHIYCKLRKVIAFGRPNEKYIMFDLQINMVTANRILKLYGKRPDLIRIGWVTDFVSARTIRKLQEITGASINYMMVDNAPIGGGCHYPWDCQGYTRDCYPCPALKISNKTAQKTLLFKNKYITKEMFITGTTNDINRAKQSRLFKNRKCMVNVALRDNPYHFSREEGRSFFEIPDDKYVIFCGAASITAERKGFKELLDSLEIVKKKVDIENVIIIVAGGECGAFPPGYDVRKVGRLSFQDMFKAYACADLFLCPSLEDSGPIMINYGVMSNIPVVAFEMGIALDIIRHKENGYIARWRNVDDYANGIVYCIKNREKIQKEIESVNNAIKNECNNRPSIMRILENNVLSSGEDIWKHL